LCAENEKYVKALDQIIKKFVGELASLDVECGQVERDDVGDLKQVLRQLRVQHLGPVLKQMF
jgi:hypothetical protein